MSLFLKMETFVYRNLVIPLQGKHTFDFVNDFYQQGQKVLDFGCGIGSNSKLFNSDDYMGVEVDESRVLSAKIKYPDSRFEKISFISTKEDKIPFQDNSFDIVFISLCLHHIDSKTCKLLFKEFSRVLNENSVPHHHSGPHLFYRRGDGLRASFSPFSHPVFPTAVYSAGKNDPPGGPEPDSPVGRRGPDGGCHPCRLSGRTGCLPSV